MKMKNIDNNPELILNFSKSFINLVAGLSGIELNYDKTEKNKIENKGGD